MLQNSCVSSSHCLIPFWSPYNLVHRNISLASTLAPVVSIPSARGRTLRIFSMAVVLFSLVASFTAGKTKAAARKASHVASHGLG